MCVLFRVYLESNLFLKGENIMAEKVKLKVDNGSAGIAVNDAAFPANSHKKQIEGPEKKVKKVIKGGVVTKKQPLSKRFISLFISDEVDDVGAYVLHDVVIPAIKSTIAEMGIGSIEMIFGESRKTRSLRDRGRASYVSYNNYDNRGTQRSSVKKQPERGSRRMFDDIILETRGDAQEVLNNLVDLTVDYGMASVGDLKDLVDIETNYTDNKWGWVSLSEASVARVREGYLINLPKPQILD